LSVANDNNADISRAASSAFAILYNNSKFSKVYGAKSGLALAIV
jgi:hypothetical protein